MERDYEFNHIHSGYGSPAADGVCALPEAEYP